MRLTILGPPGSGKGSFAKRLSKDFRVPIISVGDILREEVENQTVIGKKIKNLMGKGKLISDDIVLKIIDKKAGKSKNIIFDGFPRTMAQICVDMDKAINLICSDEICITRITNRRTCSKCKKIYNVVTEKPKKQGICDVCRGKLISRADKNVVKDRLRVFKREALPIIQYYKKQNILIDVNAEGSINEIYSEIRKIFKSKK